MKHAFLINSRQMKQIKIIIMTSYNFVDICFRGVWDALYTYIVIFLFHVNAHLIPVDFIRVRFLQYS